MRVVSELLAEFANGLEEGLIRYHHPCPYDVEHLLLRHESAGVVHELGKHLEGLRPRVELAVASAQAPSSQIEHETIELQNLRGSLLHHGTLEWAFARLDQQSIGEKSGLCHEPIRTQATFQVTLLRTLS